MKDWFRWAGIAAFAAVVAVFAAVWFLLVDIMVERTIEKVGTRAVGAKVELSSADVTLSPLGMELKGLQVTNPDEPMTNAVEVGRIAFNVETLNLLRRKVIIDEMSLDGVRFGTPRKSSGAIAQKPGKKPVSERLAQRFALPSFDVPDVNRILSDEKLETLTLAKELKADIDMSRASWQDRLKNLPDKKKIESYRTRIEKLKSSGKGGVLGVLGGVGEVKAIQEEVSADLELVKSAQSDFKSQMGGLKDRVEKLSRAPQEDINRLRDKYGLSPEGLSNMSRLVLGAKLNRSVERALYWYERAEPFIARARQKKQGKEVVIKPLRGKGVDVRFKEREPLPDFLIRKAAISITLDAGDFAGGAMNITPDQDMLGKPLTFELSGEKLKGIDRVAIDGSLNHISPDSPKDSVNLSVRGYKTGSITLSDSLELPVKLASALADVKLGAEVSGRALDARLDAALKSMSVEAGAGEDPNAVTRAMASALNGVKQFGLRADITGTLDEYDISLSSDLDRVLKDAVGNLIREQTARLESELSRAINEKVKGPVSDVTGGYAGLDKVIGGELSERINLMSGLM